MANNRPRSDRQSLSCLVTIMLTLSLILVPFHVTRPSDSKINLDPATSPAGLPVVQGYGGVLAVGSIHYNSNGPASVVFPGEQASDTEVTVSLLASEGYNAIRVSIIDPGNLPDSGTYNSNAWLRTLAIAEHFGFIVIGDDHEYDCPNTTFWAPVFTDTPQAKSPNVIWEPKNEPHCSTLSQSDQSVINLARSMGDTRWFVLGCNNDCSPDASTTDWSAFPTVNDTIGHLAYDFHEYYFYAYHSSTWSNSDGISFANQKFAGIQGVQKNIGPFIGTEFGADTGCGATGCPPDQTVSGSAGYSPESLAYLHELISKMQSAGVGYTIWNAGDWNDPPADTTGALSTFGACPPLNGPSIPCLPTPNSESSPTFTLTISGSKGGTTNPAAGSYTESANKIVMITATPDSGHQFLNFIVNGANITSNPLQVNMTINRIVEPFFAAKTSPSNGPSGSSFTLPVPLLIIVGLSAVAIIGGGVFVARRHSHGRRTLDETSRELISRHCLI